MKEYEFNPNDIEHCLERADALKALEERKLTQVMQPHSGVWNDRRDDDQFDDFQKHFRYRRKPTPIANPWYHPKHVPMPTCWLKERGKKMLVTGVCDEGVMCGGQLVTPWNNLYDIQHSTTGEAPWMPCTTLEP